MAVLDRLLQLLGGGDPEAQGAAATSTAMMPAVNQWAQNVGSGQYVRQGLPSNYDPNQSFAQNALNPNSLESALNVALGVGGGSGLGIKAYHGSPYDFSAFDASKIGTGEGAQAYGHGLYFAEHEPVAQGYRDDLTTKRPSPELIAAQNAYNKAYDAVGNVTSGTQQEFNTAIAARDAARANLDRAKVEWEAQPAPQGHMYEVNINAEPGQFLNWDKPLSEQSPYVQEALSPERLGLKPAGPVGEGGYYGYTDTGNRLIGRATTRSLPETVFSPGELGMNLYRGSGSWPDAPIASQRLNAAGIPGIRYLDQGSRGAGQGTSNYVVFDPSIIEILRKYGLAGLTAGGGLLGAADQQ